MLRDEIEEIREDMLCQRLNLTKKNNNNNTTLTVTSFDNRMQQNTSSISNISQDVSLEQQVVKLS